MVVSDFFCYFCFCCSCCCCCCCCIAYPKVGLMDLCINVRRDCTWHVYHTEYAQPLSFYWFFSHQPFLFNFWSRPLPCCGCSCYPDDDCVYVSLNAFQCMLANIRRNAWTSNDLEHLDAILSLALSRYETSASDKRICMILQRDYFNELWWTTHIDGEICCMIFIVFL